MLFSGKISNAVLMYFDRKGEDISALLEAIPLPETFLRDPNHWINAKDMEDFMSQVARLNFQLSEENILEKIGHAGPEIRGWGVLDSVLRMMPSPQENFTHPEKFISYFISPPPPLANIIKTEECISFDLPVPADQFPNTITYLRAAFESLPVYVGRQQATCRWVGINLRIDWESKQNSIFGLEDTGYQISPDLMRNIITSLEQNQKELQEHNFELQAKHEQLLSSYKTLQEELARRPELNSFEKNPIKNFEFVEQTSLEALRNEIGRLNDYMIRSQQLIQLLVAQDRMSNQVKEAMRRVNWENVRSQFPKTIESCFEILENTQKNNKVSTQLKTEV